jgi:predicted TIM-barrel fold metal-dependent hydrolase
VSGSYDGPIIDSHHHLWDLARGHYPWLSGTAAIGALGDIAYLQRDYLIADYLADIAGQGITGSVHIEAVWDRARSPAEETAWLDTLERPAGIAARYVAAAPLDSPDVGAVLAAQAACPRVAGIRETIRWHPDPARTWTRRGLVAEPGWRRGLALLARHGFVLDLLMNPHQSMEVAALADDFPDQTFIVNHCATPNDRDEAGLARWRDGLAAMGQRRNIALKLSNFSAYTPEGNPAGHRDTLLTCIDAFGPERCHGICRTLREVPRGGGGILRRRAARDVPRQRGPALSIRYRHAASAQHSLAGGGIKPRLPGLFGHASMY